MNTPSNTPTNGALRHVWRQQCQPSPPPEHPGQEDLQGLLGMLAGLTGPLRIVIERGGLLVQLDVREAAAPPVPAPVQGASETVRGLQLKAVHRCLLAEARRLGQPVSRRQLIEATGRYGDNSGSRTAITDLCKAGLLQRDPSNLYSLVDQAEAEAETEASPLDLADTGLMARDLLEALAQSGPLRPPDLAERAGYPGDPELQLTLQSLARRGLVDLEPGGLYVLTAAGHQATATGP